MEESKIDVNALNDEELQKLEAEIGQEIVKILDKSVGRAVTRLDNYLKPYGIKASLVLQLSSREEK